MQEAPIYQSHIYGWIKILQTVFEKGTQETFRRNYFKIWPEKIFKELPKKFHFIAMATRVFYEIKFCEQFLEDLQRNIPTKFGPNRPSSLWGDV